MSALSNDFLSERMMREAMNQLSAQSSSMMEQYNDIKRLKIEFKGRTKIIELRGVNIIGYPMDYFESKFAEGVYHFLREYPSGWSNNGGQIEGSLPNNNVESEPEEKDRFGDAFE